MSLMTIEESEPARAAAGSALLALGFRPLYLLAAAFAAASVPAWVASYYGHGPFQVGLAWHVHEMMFGFVVAVVVGFLFTAARAWTGLWTPRGSALGAIAGLWVAGRIAMAACPPPLAAAVDLAFLPVAAWPLYRVLRQANSKRNMFLVGLLGLLFAANATYHASVLGWIGVSPLRPIYAAILVVVLIESAIGGRVIPMFTSNAVKGVKTVSNPRTDKLALVFTVAAGAAWVVALPAYVTALLALGAALFQGLRLAGWKPLCTLHNPLLWILHLSYVWIPFGFLLLALSQFGVVPQSAAVHVLAVGAIGGLILGMITRTALGHTGRPLAAGPKETAMYVLVQLGVFLRLVAALSPDSARDVALVGAATCWSAAFALYVIVYGPYLCRPRIDGREG